MKLSKKQRELNFAKESKYKQKETEKAEFFDKISVYFKNGKTVKQDSREFETISGYFANTFNFGSTYSYFKKYPEISGLTPELFEKWLAISDEALRTKTVLDWIDTAKNSVKEHKLYLIKQHPYRLYEILTYITWDVVVSNFDFLKDGENIDLTKCEIIDIITKEVFKYDELEEYNSVHYPEIDISKEKEWIRKAETCKHTVPCTPWRECDGESVKP